MNSLGTAPDAGVRVTGPGGPDRGSVGRWNIAATLGGWSTRHRKTAILGWLVLVVAATVLGSAVGQKQMSVQEYAKGDSAQAAKILSQAGIVAPAGEMVLVHSDTLAATSTGFQTAVRTLMSGLTRTGQVADLRDPYVTGLVSADKHSVLVQFAMTGDAMSAPDRVQPVLDAVAATRTAHPELTIDQFGDASANAWFNDTIGKDFQRAEWTAVPLALGILLVAFGAFLAAVLPVALAMTAFLAANGMLALISQRMHVDPSTSSVMLLVGLAVGVDYCMFYLRREREERARGRDPGTSLRIAAATSGRSVLVSGLTVVVAMSGMFLSGMLLFDGFGLATILVVLVAMLGSVTVLPALLSLLGDRVAQLREQGGQHGQRPEHGDGDDEDRRQAEGGEGRVACEEHAGHRDHHRQARDEHRAAGRGCRSLDRGPRAPSGRTLLALALQVEHRVVDADREPDEQQHGADVGIHRHEVAR